MMHRPCNWPGCCAPAPDAPTDRPIAIWEATCDLHRPAMEAFHVVYSEWHDRMAKMRDDLQLAADEALREWLKDHEEPVPSDLSSYIVHPCPTCGAGPGEWCRDMRIKSHRSQCGPHHDRPVWRER